MLAVTLLAAMALPGHVEAGYARGAYPWIAGVLARASGLAPFAVAEPAAVALAIAAPIVLVRFLRGWRRACAVVAAAASAYLLFLACWGLNYRRLPFAATSGLDVAPVAVAELVELGGALVAESNASRVGRREDGQAVFRAEEDVLARAPRGNARLRAAWPALAGPTPRPKPALASPLLARLGIAGIYVPFTAEPLVNALLPEAERPFSAAHEIAHAQGIAREDEANFVAALACLSHDDDDFRYSGALVASFYVLGALRGVDAGAARDLEAQRSDAVRRDIAAIAAWNARYEGALQEAGERVNDAYLRSQGAREGVRSYGRMVDLLVAERRRTRVLGSAP